MNIPKYSLENSKIIYFFLAVMLIGGVYSFFKLPKKEDAPFVIKQAVLVTQYPGATPFEVENWSLSQSNVRSSLCLTCFRSSLNLISVCLRFRLNFSRHSTLTTCPLSGMNFAVRWRISTPPAEWRFFYLSQR